MQAKFNIFSKFSDYTLRQWIGLLVISGLLLIESVDANILNVAIPQMANTFRTSVFTLKLAVTSYLIGLSVFIPISGWIADRFGTKNTLMFSIVLFSVMSIQCGLTNSVPWLVISRLLQGASGAFMVPVARLLLLKIFPKAQMVKAYTIMGMPTLLGPICAPILGGYLVSYFSWRYIFWVNVPLGIISLLLTIRFIENYTEVQQRFNLLSYLFLALFLSCLCFGLDVVLLNEVSFIIKCILLGTALLFGILYYFVEANTEFPVVRYRLFKLRTFNICFFSSIIVRCALGGRAFIFAIFLELTFHLSAFEAGFFFIYIAFGVLCSRSLVRLMLERYGFKRWLTFANFGNFVALLMLAIISSMGPLLYIALFLNGIFASAQFMTINMLYYAEVDNVDYGSAVSVAATWQQLAMSLGIIMAAALLHFSNELSNNQFSLNSFHITFAGLALINLACQLLINRLNVADGHSLLVGKYKSKTS